MFILQGILKAESQEKTLIYILVREQGYGRKIADFFDLPVSPIQKQLLKLENAGVLMSKRIGTTLCFEFNPRYPFLEPLKELLKAALKAYPPELKKELVMQRDRPRHSRKPANYINPTTKYT